MNKKELMKKHKYSPELIERIQSDDDYVLHLFTVEYLKTHDKLYLPKRRKNGDYTMKCILHRERTPSFRYSSKRGIFKCFGCGQGGTILSLIKKYYDISFFESITRALQIKNNPNELKFKRASVVSGQLSFNYPPHVDPMSDNDDLPF